LDVANCVDDIVGVRRVHNRIPVGPIEARVEGIQHVVRKPSSCGWIGVDCIQRSIDAPSKLENGGSHVVGSLQHDRQSSASVLEGGRIRRFAHRVLAERSRELRLALALTEADDSVVLADRSIASRSRPEWVTLTNSVVHIAVVVAAEDVFSANRLRISLERVAKLVYASERNVEVGHRADIRTDEGLRDHRVRTEPAIVQHDRISESLVVADERIVQSSLQRRIDVRVERRDSRGVGDHVVGLGLRIGERLREVAVWVGNEAKEHLNFGLGSSLDQAATAVRLHVHLPSSRRNQARTFSGIKVLTVSVTLARVVIGTIGRCWLPLTLLVFNDIVVGGVIRVDSWSPRMVVTKRLGHISIWYVPHPLSISIINQPDPDLVRARIELQELIDVIVCDVDHEPVHVRVATSPRLDPSTKHRLEQQALLLLIGPLFSRTWRQILVDFRLTLVDQLDLVVAVKGRRSIWECYRHAREVLSDRRQRESLCPSVNWHVELRSRCTIVLSIRIGHTGVVPSNNVGHDLVQLGCHVDVTERAQRQGSQIIREDARAIDSANLLFDADQIDLNAILSDDVVERQV